MASPALREVGRSRDRTPLVLAIPAVVATLFLVLPLVSLVVRSPWRDLGSLLQEAEVGQALRLSLLTATSATAVALVLGVPLAWVLARRRLPGHSLLRALVTLPLVMPPVVGGVALLYACGRVGLVGRYLDLWFGITIPFTTFAVVMAEAFVAMPFLIITVEGALRAADQGYDEAAATLGASRLRTFWTVTLPLVRPSLLAGTVLCWARALGEFGATITFAGSFAGSTRTMPIAIYLTMVDDPRAGTALALVMLIVSVAVLLLLRERWWYAGDRTSDTASGGSR